MKLSVIIPVCNVEQYIGPCLESIYRQGLSDKDFEVIVVNDGSTDNSMQVVEDIRLHHHNIQIIHQDHAGPSVCRNEGMEMAKKYINTIVSDFEEGQVLDGVVVSIKEFGAFVEFAPGKEGMVHISKIANRRIEHVEDVLTLGDKVTVVCLGKDRMGRLSFSMKDVANNKKKNNK